MKKLLLFLFLFLFFIPTDSYSSEIEKTVSVVNPIRGNELGLENIDLLDSLKGQINATNSKDVNATWLWQYSALENTDLIEFAKSRMTNEEMGIFLEIDRNFSNKADVDYRGRGPWYFSDGIFIFSYDLNERKKYIDTVFDKFNKTFGYYPKTVGAWWIDSWSLNYMNKKYGVTGAIRAAEQLDLDVYSIWGAPWSVPYLSSKTSALIPAQDLDNSTGVVTIHWAPRDPLYGYGSDSKASLNSLQDYHLLGKDLDYFESLLKTYLDSTGHYAVFGLEGGFDQEVYEGLYSDQLELIKNLENEDYLKIQTVKDYSQGFIDRPYKSYSYVLKTDEETGDQGFWYQNGNYRVGMNKIGDVVRLIDIRDYNKQQTEEYYYLPNSQGYLRVSSPAILDTSKFTNQSSVAASSPDNLKITEENGSVFLNLENKKIAEFHKEFFEVNDKTYLKNSSEIKNELSVSRLIVITIFISFALYLIVNLMVFRENKFKLFSTAFLVVPLIFMIYNLRFILTDNIIFILNPKMIIFSPFLYLPNTIINKLLIGYYIIPVILLTLVHYFLLVRANSVRKNYIYILFVSVYMFAYSKTPYFPVDRSSTAPLLVLGLLFIFAVGTLLKINIKRLKSLKNYLVALILIIIAGFLYVTLIMYSRYDLVLNKFELNALEFIKDENNQSLEIVKSEQEPIYKEVRTAIFEYPFLINLLTGKDEDKSRSFVFIPRYTGAKIENDEIIKNNLQLVFDNGSILIYKRN